jgi:excisionase family DNA binding protein
MKSELLKELQEIKVLLALQKQVLTLDEFCVYAGISKSHAYHLTSSRKIKYYRPFGKMIYFDIADVIDFLRQNQVNSEAEVNKNLSNYFLNNKK